MTITYIGSSLANAGNQDTGPTSPAVNSTGADLIVAWLQEYAPNASGVLTDSYANTWIEINESVASDYQVRTIGYYCVAPTVGSGHTLDSSNGVALGSYAILTAGFYAGVDQVNPIDQSAFREAFNGYSPAVFSPGLTPSRAGSLVVFTCGYGIPDTGATVSVDVGTVRQQAGPVTFYSYSGAYADVIQTTAVLCQPTFTPDLATSGNPVPMSMTVFNAAGAPPPGTSPFAYIGSASSKFDSSSSGLTPAVNSTGADLMVVLTAVDGGQTVTDTYGNTLTTVSDIIHLTFYYCANPTVGSGHQASCLAGYPSIAVAWYSGLDTSDPVDTYVKQSTAGGVSSVTVNPGVRPVLDGALIVSACADSMPSDGYGVSQSPGTMRTFQAHEGSVNYSIGLGDLIQGMAAYVETTFTQSASVTGNDTNAMMVVFNPAPQPPPTVTSCSPNAGALGGGTAVTITGTDFDAVSGVTFGGNAATSVVTVNSTTVTCVTPSHTAGAVNVTVTNGDSQTGTGTGIYTYQAAPTVSSVSASSGPAAGGTNVTVTGTGFTTTVTSVTFGGNAATSVVRVSDTSITCTTPSHSAGLVNVVVTNNDTQTGTGVNVYTYVAAPTVTSCSPNAGALGGGTSVTITGTDFSATILDVTFGGTSATSIVRVSSTSITCVTPSHTAGSVNVVVTNSDSQTGTGVSAYTYQAAPTVTLVSANSGPAAGGTNVTITGTGFTTTVSGVTFGGTPATSVVRVSSTSITCTTPAHSAGAVNVTVTNNDGQTGTGTNAYTYVAAPTVTSVTPNSGTTAGGDPVSVTGTGFSGVTGVTFGGTSATSIITVNSTTVTCVTPAHAAGAVNVTATNGDGQTGTGVNAFTYVVPSGGGTSRNLNSLGIGMSMGL